MKRTSVHTVAIGSMNRAKIRAVRLALSRLWPEASYQPLDVPSGVSAMPMSDEEASRGAVARATGARERTSADIGVGLEGSVTDTPRGMFLTGWVAIVDRSGRTGLASGARVLLPESVARQLRAGYELAPIIDRLSGCTDTRHNCGATGYLTGGLLPRYESFAVALTCALAPFIRPELYRTDDRVPGSEHSEEI